MRLAIQWYGNGQPSDLLRLRSPDGELHQFRSGAFIPADLVALFPAHILREIASEGMLVDLDEAQEVAQASARSTSDFFTQLRSVADGERKRRFDLLLTGKPARAAAIAANLSKE